jgi:FAD/FMN-containing dehydrogenase
MIDAAIAVYEKPTPPEVVVAFIHHGGEISRVKPTATAFSHRDAQHSVLIQAAWDHPEDSEPRMRWARDTFKAIESLTDGFYVNTLSREDSDRRVRANYGSNHDRLVALKNKYDPTNLFRLNANVKPSV